MKLYRYREVNAFTFSEIAEKKAWFSKYTELNDPYEGRYINRSNNTALDDLIKTFRVCCFSRNQNNLLMWAHYAENHRGICLEYDVLEDSYKHDFIAVVYSKNQPVIENVRYFPESDPNAGAISAHINKEGLVFRTKSEDWKYEEEIRQLRIAEQPLQLGEKHPVRGGELSGVYFGLRTDEASKKIISKLSNGTSIQFYQATLKSDQFALEFSTL